MHRWKALLNGQMHLKRASTGLSALPEWAGLPKRELIGNDKQSESDGRWRSSWGWRRWRSLNPHGNVYGTVSDESGAVLPGASIEMVGAEGGNRTTTSGSQGDFRFLNMANGKYALRVTLTGFADHQARHHGDDRRQREHRLLPQGRRSRGAGRGDRTTPAIDIRKVGTATTLTQEELARIPQGPRSLGRAEPGAGGAVWTASASPATRQVSSPPSWARARRSPDTMWTYDGVNITDVTSYGASSSLLRLRLVRRDQRDDRRRAT